MKTPLALYLSCNMISSLESFSHLVKLHMQSVCLYAWTLSTLIWHLLQSIWHVLYQCFYVERRIGRGHVQWKASSLLWKWLILSYIRLHVGVYRNKRYWTYPLPKEWREWSPQKSNVVMRTFCCRLKELEEDTEYWEWHMWKWTNQCLAWGLSGVHMQSLIWMG